MHDGLPLRHMCAESDTESDSLAVVVGVVVGGEVVVVGPRRRCGRGGAIAIGVMTDVGHDVPPTADMLCERCHQIVVVQLLSKEYQRLTAPSAYGDL